MSEGTDRVDNDVPENAGVPRGEGESWAELAERLQEGDHTDASHE